MLIIDAREVFLQDKLGFVSDGLLKARINVLKMGIMTNPTAKSVWATYKRLVEPEFANYFESQIYPDGIEDDAIKVNPLYKSKDNDN